jgi:hypothetical protein
LVLHGIGGNTIAQAKENLTQREALAWARYIAKRGSLNVGTRIEQGIARLAVIWIHTQGGKAQMADFMPHADQPTRDDDEKPATVQQAFQLFQSLKKASV